MATWTHYPKVGLLSLCLKCFLIECLSIFHNNLVSARGLCPGLGSPNFFAASTNLPSRQGSTSHFIRLVPIGTPLWAAILARSERSTSKICSLGWKIPSPKYLYSRRISYEGLLRIKAVLSVDIISRRYCFVFSTFSQS